MPDADDTAATTETWEKAMDIGGWAIWRAGADRVRELPICSMMNEADADAILRLKDEAREAQQLRAALREVERIDTYWRDGGSGNEYGPCAEVALAALEASTTATGGAP